MVRIELKGFDKVMKKLDRLAANARALSGEHRVPVSELFNPDFMRAHASVGGFQEFIERGGLEFETEAEFAAIPVSKWDEVVRAQTRFDSWADMKRAAGAEWAKRQLLA